MADAQERLDKSQDNLDLSNLQSDIQQRVQNAITPTQKSFEQARGNIELQQMKNEQAIDDASKEVDKARDKVNDATRELNGLELTQRQVQAQIDEIENTLDNAIRDQKEQLEILRMQESAAAEKYSDLARTIGDEKKETVDAKEEMNKARAARQAAEDRIANDEKTASDNLVKAKDKLKDINLQIKEKSAAEKTATIDLEKATTDLERVRIDAAKAEREVKNQLDELVKATDNEARARNDAANAARRAQKLKDDADNAIANAELNAANQVALIDSRMQGLQNAIDSANNAL